METCLTGETYDGITNIARENINMIPSNDEKISTLMTPNKFSLKGNYPNPFNPSTTIRYGLDTDSYVTVDIYDITGQLISTLYKNNQTQGWHSVIWSGTNQYGEQVPAGLYFCRIATGNEFKTTKLMLLK